MYVVPHIAQEPGNEPVLLGAEREVDMFAVDLLVLQADRGLLCSRDSRLRFFGESFKVHPSLLLLH
jgi:hypothetical protein